MSTRAATTPVRIAEYPTCHLCDDAINNAGHVAFWHLPRTGGSAVATGMFDVMGLTPQQRTLRTVVAHDGRSKN